jgi:hypothetical protein
MKHIVLITITLLILTACTNPVTRGDKRIHCTKCEESLNPYANEGKHVTVVDVKGEYLQYVNKNGDTTNSSIRHFNENTYMSGQRVGHDNHGGSVMLLFLVFLFISILFLYSEIYFYEI